MTTQERKSPLFAASEKGDEALVQFFLEHGASIEAADYVRRGAQSSPQYTSTPLYIASFYGHEGIVRLLLDRGASPDVRCHVRKHSAAMPQKDQRAIDVACEYGEDPSRKPFIVAMLNQGARRRRAATVQRRRGARRPRGESAAPSCACSGDRPRQAGQRRGARRDLK